MNFVTLANITEKYRGKSEYAPEELVFYVRKGYSAATIAKLLKTTTNEIKRALIDYEIDPQHVSTEEVVKMYKSGLPSMVIADKLNITPLATFYKLVKGGIFLNKKSLTS